MDVQPELVTVWPAGPDRGAPRRIATLSVHTSPLDQPGTGDAGGLNVYVVEVAKRLARRGIEVEIFTRAVCRDTPPLAELAPGVLVRSVVAGPFEELDKNELPAQVCQFTFEVLRTEADVEPGRYDLVHAHYWLSGKVGAVAKERWGVPLVQSMHTLGKVKNAALASGDCAEPAVRIRGELEVVAAADRLIANTAEEARQLIELYGADPAKVKTVSPGADLRVFRPGGSWPDVAAAARARAGRGRAGLRGPGPAAQGAGRGAQGRGLAAAPGAGAGGPAAGGVRRRAERVRGGAPGRLDGLASPASGLAGSVRFEPPCPHGELADWYRAATLVLAPSHSESFGLVALEAQACGTPVVAAARGRAAHRGPGRLLRRAGGRPRPRGVGRGACGPDRFAGPAGRAVAGRAGARVRVRLVRDRGPADRGVYRGHGFCWFCWLC